MKNEDYSYLGGHFETGDEMVEFAKGFAVATHAGQPRKYTGEPYVFHALEVAVILGKIMANGVPDFAYAAAILHDTVEDAANPGATLDALEMTMPKKVVDLVIELTDKSQKSDGNRAARKKIDRENTWKTSFWAQNIKLADMISNTADIVCHDMDFAKVYLPEKRALLMGMRPAFSCSRSMYDAALQSLKAAENLLELYEFLTPLRAGKKTVQPDKGGLGRTIPR